MDGALLTLDKGEILRRYPALFERGVLLGIARDELWSIILAVADVLPKHYTGEHLDRDTAHCVQQTIGEALIQTIKYRENSRIFEADLQVFHIEIAQIAFDVKLHIPAYLFDYMYVCETDDLLLIRGSYVLNGVSV